MLALNLKIPLVFLLFTCFPMLGIGLSHVVMEPWLLEDLEYYGTITNAN